MTWGGERLIFPVVYLDARSHSQSDGVQGSAVHTGALMQYDLTRKPTRYDHFVKFQDGGILIVAEVKVPSEAS